MDKNYNQKTRFIIEARDQTYSEIAQHRLDQSLFQRFGKFVVYKAAAEIGPHILARQLGSYKFLGIGGEQIVFEDKKGEHILKLLRDTMGANHDEAREWSSHYQQMSDQAQTYLGKHWLETAFYPVQIPVPGMKDYYTVGCTQPVVESEADFETMKELAFYEASPEYIKEVSELYDKILKFRKETGNCPDLFPRNLALTRLQGQPLLQIIDTIPLTPERLSGFMPDGQTIVREQINRNIDFLQLPQAAI